MAGAELHQVIPHSTKRAGPTGREFQAGVFHALREHGNAAVMPECYHRAVLKLMLMSIIFATVAVPSVGARIRDPRRALGFVLAMMGVVFLAYGFFLRFLYERFL
jgi:hypothetical protein